MSGKSSQYYFLKYNMQNTLKDPSLSELEMR